MDNPSSKLRVQITLAQILFFLNAAIWVFFLFLFLRDQVTPGDPISSWLVPILMVGNAIAMLVCGLGLRKRTRFFYYLAVTVIGINILLTFTDQVGLFDYLTLLIDLVILVLLVASRAGFTSSPVHQDLPKPSP